MVRDGLYFLIPLGAATAVALWVDWDVAAGVLAGVGAFIAFFFRDPRREVPTDRNIIVSPADGRVVRIDRGNGQLQLSIFLSLFNVHVNRSPIAGIVTDVRYTKGRFHAAFRESASVENEQNTLTIKGSQVTATCSQIAGIVARRIVCWKHPGDSVERGERIGLIRFGSRVDLTLPSNVDLKVRKGDAVRGGSSTIAIIKAR